MSKFSLSKASGGKETKRPAESATSGPPNKVPRASEITIEAGPKPSAAPRRRPAVAPVQVCIYKYTEDAGDCWETFKGDNVNLWQIQIDHGAQRSICFRLRESFEDYLRSANASDEAMPTTVADLEKAPSCSPYFPCHDISMFGNAGIIERVSKSLRKSGV